MIASVFLSYATAPPDGRVAKAIHAALTKSGIKNPRLARPRETPWWRSFQREVRQGHQRRRVVPLPAISPLRRLEVVPTRALACRRARQARHPPAARGNIHARPSPWNSSACSTSTSERAPSTACPGPRGARPHARSRRRPRRPCSPRCVSSRRSPRPSATGTTSLPSPTWSSWSSRSAPLAPRPHAPSAYSRSSSPRATDQDDAADWLVAAWNGPPTG